MWIDKEIQSNGQNSALILDVNYLISCILYSLLAPNTKRLLSAGC